MKTIALNRAARGRPNGFTLIELMIVVALIAILTAIAYPSYVSHVSKTRRADAKTALLDLAARQERFFSINNVYATTPGQLGYSGTAFPVDVQTSSQAYYQLTASANPSTTFAASAVPTGAQSNDSCGTYTVNQLGVQGNGNNTTASADCW
jgi:type IV pilus assembly protein PilE